MMTKGCEEPQDCCYHCSLDKVRRDAEEAFTPLASIISINSTLLFKNDKTKFWPDSLFTNLLTATLD